MCRFLFLALFCLSFTKIGVAHAETAEESWLSRPLIDTYLTEAFVVMPMSLQIKMKPYDGSFISLPLYHGHIVDKPTPNSCVVILDSLRVQQDSILDARPFMKILEMDFSGDTYSLYFGNGYGSGIGDPTIIFIKCTGTPEHGRLDARLSDLKRWLNNAGLDLKKDVPPQGPPHI